MRSFAPVGTRWYPDWCLTGARGALQFVTERLWCPTTDYERGQQLSQQMTLLTQYMFDHSYTWPYDLWIRYGTISKARRISPSWVEHANRYSLTREALIMPRKHQRGNAALSEFSFVRCRLSRDDKDAFKAWLAKSPIELLPALDHYLSQGVKVSWSWDDSNDTFICSFTQKGEVSPNANRCMTSRGPDPFTALAVNVFKDQVMYEGGVWEDLDTDDDIG